jgi:large-conductance mechanosensitive channel
LGIYIGEVVQELVNSLIMPLIEFVYPTIQPEGVDYVLSAGPILDSLITFIIVALVVFIIVKVATRIGIE